MEKITVTAAPPDPVGAAAFSSLTLDGTTLKNGLQLDAGLAAVPGVSLFRRNSSLSANPTTQGLSLRAIAPSGAGRALVTLDGVPQNDPFGGWVIWSALPPEDIAQAEIVRGAGAGPYGAGALTGIVALTEGRDSLTAQASAGGLGQRRAAVSGGTDWGPLSLFASASRAASQGWIPVSPIQRGEADEALTADSSSASLRLETEPQQGALLSARFAAYREARHSGVTGTRSKTDGILASVTAARLPEPEALGWRAQFWVHTSDFAQTSASLSADRNTAALTNEQYATPATGLGANAALRGKNFLDWEVGADFRMAHGNAKERTVPVAGNFTQDRTSGGNAVTGGIYAETALRKQAWLFTLGVRADAWKSSDGHLIQTDLAGGAVTKTVYDAKSGLLPSLRLGIRQDHEAFYWRVAAYEGFRTPSLNELYRPFRLGNNLTLANAGLKPEALYGVEAGAGGKSGPLAWDVTVFWNRLHDAITNVTIGTGPVSIPGAGFVPSGGLLIQRQNAGNIDAPGVEGNLFYTRDDIRLRFAFTWLDQQVTGIAKLDGLRPAQAPRATITTGADLALTQSLTIGFSLRYESNRFADDANRLALGSAVNAALRLDWQVADGVGLYWACDNLLNRRNATTLTADGIYSYDSPRAITAGLRLRA